MAILGTIEAFKDVKSISHYEDELAKLAGEASEECCICMEHYANMRFEQCGHTQCASCLHNIIKANRVWLRKMNQ